MSDFDRYEEITAAASQAARELIAAAKPENGDIFVIGCSSSEICGKKIGSFSNLDAAKAVFEGVYPLIKKNGLYLAAQCCEHLNRSLIVEKECAVKYGLTVVNVVPHPHAGGAFATIVYGAMEHPAAVEEVPGTLGMDIGSTLIGMHIIPVCVPVRVSVNKIGEANLVLCRRRPKFVGGERAIYDKDLM